MQKKSTKMSVPQFGGWEHKSGVPTDYSMVFNQARENKKTQKTDLAEVKRLSLGNERNERDTLNGNRHHGNGHGHGHAHAHGNGHGHVHAHGHAPSHGHGPSHGYHKEDPPLIVRP